MPLGVDLEAVQRDVHARARDVVTVAEVEDGDLEVTAGVGEVVVQQLGQHGRARC
jgi:hypothetical protein